MVGFGGGVVSGEPTLLERLRWIGAELAEKLLDALVIFVAGLPFMIIFSLGAGR